MDERRVGGANMSVELTLYIVEVAALMLRHLIDSTLKRKEGDAMVCLALPCDTKVNAFM